MLPLTQAAAGWLLVLTAIAVFALGFILRWLVRTRRNNAPVRNTVRRLRGSVPVCLLFGPAPDSVEGLGDEEIDHVTLIPMVALAAAVFLAGTGFVLADSFGVEFRLFRAP